MTKKLSLSPKTWMAYLLLLLLLWPAQSIRAEIHAIDEQAEAYAGDNQSKNEVRQLALLEAKRRALERAGVYVRSLTVVKLAQVEQDDILVFTAGVARTDILKEEFFLTPEGNLGARVLARVQIDTDQVEKEIQRFSQQGDLREMYRDLLDKHQKLESDFKSLQARQQIHGPDPAEAQKLTDRARALELLQQAVERVQRQQWQDALKLVQQAVKLAPDMPLLYNNRGFIFQKMGRIPEARQDYNQAIALDASYSPAWFNRGNQSLEQGQLDAALQDYSQALRLKPDFDRALNNRAYTYSRLGQFNLALQDYNQLVQANPNNPHHWFNRGIFLQNNQKKSEAERDLQAAVRLSPRPEYLIELAALELDRGALVPGIQHLNEVLRQMPKSHRAYNLRGVALVQTGKAMAGLGDLNQAIELAQPQVPAIYYVNRGLTQVKLDMLQLAERDFQKALSLEPDNIPAHMSLGELYRQAGQCPRAQSHYQRACQLGYAAACQRSCP